MIIASILNNSSCVKVCHLQSDKAAQNDHQLGLHLQSFGLSDLREMM